MAGDKQNLETELSTQHINLYSFDIRHKKVARYHICIYNNNYCKFMCWVKVL